ncbi:MAG: hypothetical protein ACOH2N_03120 [Devosia sp.]
MKLETIKSKLAKAAPGAVIGPFEIDLGHINTDPTFQVRFRLDETNKGRIRAAYKSGAEVAPISLAFIDGSDGYPVIIDGHHRVTVLETLSAEASFRGGDRINTVMATFTQLGREEARYQAAQANTKHGLNLTGKESRRVLGRYVEAGHHRNADGTYKSYREIGKTLSRTHNTISAWMKADYPQEARNMENVEMAKSGGVGAPVPLVLVKHKAQEAMLDLKNMFEQARSLERAGILQGIWSLIEEMERIHERTDNFFHDHALDFGDTPSNDDDQPF